MNNILSIDRGCVGCAACMSKCPSKCIEMEENSEGFLRPNIKEIAKCSQCGLCLSTCPAAQNPSPKQNIKRAFAFSAQDRLTLQSSSSGGAFTQIAEFYLRQNGYICACKSDENLSPCHRITDKATELGEFRGSKYVQSNLGNVFAEIKKLLSLQKGPVFFVGTPCQTAALNLFLGNTPRAQLLVADLICHGNASIKAWKKYLAFREAEEGSTVCKSNFRSKESGWHNFKMSLDFQNKVRKSYRLDSDPYLRGFMSNLFLMPSCYTCKYKGERHIADLSLGDFWGVENFPEVPVSHNGVSLILVHTDKGQQILEQAFQDTNVVEVNFPHAIFYNSAYAHSAPSNRRSKKFFQALDRENFGSLIETCLKKDMIDIIMYYIRAIRNKVAARLQARG